MVMLTVVQVCISLTEYVFLLCDFDLETLNYKFLCIQVCLKVSEKSVRSQVILVSLIHVLKI